MGAPHGNRNALKHGRFTNTERSRSRELAALRRRARDLERRAAQMLAYAAAKIAADAMSRKGDCHAPPPCGRSPEAGSSSVMKS
jgi:hypothetical protein